MSATPNHFINEEVHQLEVETFEIEDLAEIEQIAADSSTSTSTSTSSCSTSSSTTSCTSTGSGSTAAMQPKPVIPGVTK